MNFNNSLTLFALFLCFVLIESCSCKDQEANSSAVPTLDPRILEFSTQIEKERRTNDLIQMSLFTGTIITAILSVIGFVVHDHFRFVKYVNEEVKNG
ncbi:hypothetical protein, conserved [Plasmodium gonderi]|uniref:Variable surface protein n=1 Tax=Plasmodium gonderi TaxID=77519 RepID=A0A1Y1JI18_PLAGO|nr:hypothetical protein, conserved [Plasmodium gonderi]GAW80093.1 hypothetical protein, conserved [Plasmodium gonderi]